VWKDRHLVNMPVCTKEPGVVSRDGVDMCGAQRVQSGADPRGEKAPTAQARRVKMRRGR